MAECCIVGSNAAPPIAACPVNGARSKRVDLLTVRSLVRHLPLGMPHTTYYFCESPDCEVVYFSADPVAPVFRRADVLVRVGAKEQEDPIPVCYCFGFTKKDILDEIAQTGRSTVAARIKAEVKAGNCACEVKNPSGKCCLGAVGRVAQQAQKASRRENT
ncbi:MAG: putative iron-sulfur cluster-binding metallochaperone [Candidatus Acidiferrales bacterium]